MTPLATRASLWNRWWNGLHSSASVRGEQSRRGSIAVSRGRALLPTAMNLQACALTLDQSHRLHEPAMQQVHEAAGGVRRDIAYLTVRDSKRALSARCLIPSSIRRCMRKCICISITL